MTINGRILLALASLSLLYTGCGGDAAERDTAPAPSAATAAPFAETDTVMTERLECVDRVEGYSVAYPARWQTNTGEVLGPCSIFHPDPFEIPRDSEMPVELAVTIGFENMPFAELTGEMPGRREISRERTTVDGRAAVRMVSESTGDGLHERDLRAYQYFVDLGDETMVATTYDAGEPTFERRRRVLDAMMRSFDFRQPG